MKVELFARLREAQRKVVELTKQLDATVQVARGLEAELHGTERAMKRLEQEVLSEITGYRWNPETMRVELDGKEVNPVVASRL